MLEETEEMIQNICQVAEKYAPSYDEKCVYEDVQKKERIKEGGEKICLTNQN